MHTNNQKIGPEALFIVPPKDLSRAHSSADRVYGCNYGFDYKPPVHLLLLATSAQSAGCCVRLLDCPAEGYNRKKLIAYLENHKPIDVAVFFTVWLSYDQDREAAKLISFVHKGVKTVFTGPLPTWKPELFINTGNDFVIRGEPEAALAEFLRACGKEDLLSIKNLSYRYDGSFRHNISRAPADVNSLPIPNRRLLLGRYSFTRIFSSPATVMCTSRGCSYRCTYCAPHALDQAIETESMKNASAKPPLRMRDADKVIEEFEEIALLGYKGVEICDNQFVWGKERVHKICARISSLGLEWICYGRADHLLDMAMLKSMRQAGCRQIYIGTESFCQEILDDTRKQLQLGDIHKAVRMVREAGIDPEVSVLLGASGLETEETIARSQREARKCKTRFIHYSIALPVPHTQLYQLAKEKKWFRTGDFVPVDNIRTGLLDLPHIKAKRLEFLVRKFYAQQYLSFSFIASQILSRTFFRNYRLRLSSFLKLLTYLFKGDRGV